MSKNYINGCLYPVIEVQDVQDRIIDTLTFPITDKSGLIELNEIIKDEYLTPEKKIIQFIEGYRIHFSLSYETKMISTHSLKVQKLLNYAKDGYRIFLYPRADLLYRAFEVLWENKEIIIGILKGKYNAKGNRLIKLEFQTVNVEQNLKWLDPDAFPIVKFMSPMNVAILTSNT